MRTCVFLTCASCAAAFTITASPSYSPSVARSRAGYLELVATPEKTSLIGGLGKKIRSLFGTPQGAPSLASRALQGIPSHPHRIPHTRAAANISPAGPLCGCPPLPPQDPSGRSLLSLGPRAPSTCRRRRPARHTFPPTPLSAARPAPSSRRSSCPRTPRRSSPTCERPRLPTHTAAARQGSLSSPLVTAGMTTPRRSGRASSTGRTSTTRTSTRASSGRACAHREAVQPPSLPFVRCTRSAPRAGCRTDA